MVSPGLTLSRSTANVPRKEGAEAINVVGAVWDTDVSNLEVTLISKDCPTPSFISTGRRARNRNRACWPVFSLGVSVTEGSPALTVPEPSASWKKTACKDGGKVEV